MSNVSVTRRQSQGPKPLEKISQNQGGERPWLARSWLAGRQGPGPAVMGKMSAGLEHQGVFLPDV